jgi:eukaryotic-like serine/threonine-protein kinase
MALAPGTRLGPYEILSALGAGGMGEVYRARDTKLNRDVAIKVLPDSVARDPERLIRFEREARVLAALNHPNIAHIHGLEDSTGTQALVMELVEGPTLADRLAGNPITVEDALPIAQQLAEALEAAHERGIIHRDLKPANIKVRLDGVVKVLDFGLAKIGAGEVLGQALSQVSTETVDGTRAGIILGTTAYMSPEQARGLPVDQRTDIWAFGCVLYEMLTGRSAFGGRTISDTIARILEREPNWQLLPRSTPRTIRDLLRRCLRKDLQTRLHDIAVARRQIGDAVTRLGGRRKVIGLLRIAAGATVALTIVGTLWWLPWKLIHRESDSTRQHESPSIRHEPIGILIADFRNQTGDPIFDHTLEPMLRLALEGAGFINAYNRSRIRPTFGIRPPEQLDGLAARELALKYGLSMVLSGSIDRKDRGYDISVEATQPATGKVVASSRSRASSRDQVLAALTNLVTAVRKALGDETSDSAQLLAMRSLSTTSIEVASHYGAAIEAQSNGTFEDARQSFLKAVQLDPKFGLGYQGLALLSRNVGNSQDAEKYTAEALTHLDGMTDREAFAVRAFYYMNTGDFYQCAKEYSELLAKYTADAAAHNNRALCLSKLRNLRDAVDEMRQALTILPTRVVYRNNLTLFANYAGDFNTAEKEARALQEPSDLTALALAFAQVGQGLIPEAMATYQRLRTLSARGRSGAASGLGDIALYEGRFSDAVRIFEEGVVADLAVQNRTRAARKFAAVANAQLLRRKKDLAITAAEQALVNSQTGAVRFLAARVFVQAGAGARARIEAARISLGTFVDPSSTGAAGGVAAEPEAYAKIIEAELALANEDPRQAIKFLTEANTLADTWLGHFDLGLAYLKVPAFAKADSEFDQCFKRRGEAMSLFFDEEPTYGVFPPVFYYQGIAREGLNRPDFNESFRAYMDLRAKSTEDTLLREIRQRTQR